MTEFVVHPIPPLFDKDSEVLILGSFPSVKSREAAFFYGHPQNRFWKVIARLFDAEVPSTVSDKTELILKNHLALWDSIASCEIHGSSDSSIQNVVVNDLSPILNGSKIKAVFCNGATSYSFYQKYIEPKTNIKAQKLPSTSPANASWSLDRLCEAWQVIKKG